MDLSMLSEIVYWHWLILASVLLILEFLVAGTFFRWTAIAAAAVSLLLLVYPKMGWQTQVAIFAVISVVCLTLWRLWHSKKSNMELPSPLCAHGRGIGVADVCRCHRSRAFAGSGLYHLYSGQVRHQSQYGAQPAAGRTLEILYQGIFDQRCKYGI